MSTLSEPAPDDVGHVPPARWATALKEAVKSWGAPSDRTVSEHGDEVLSLAAAFDSFLAHGPAQTIKPEDPPPPPSPTSPTPLPPELPGALGAMSAMIRRSALAPKILEAALAWADALPDSRVFVSGSSAFDLINAVRAYRGQEPLT